MGTYDRLNESAKSSVATVDITIDSQYVVACYADGKLVFFNFQTGEQLSSVNHGGVLKFCEWNQKPGAETPATERLVVTFTRSLARQCSDGCLKHFFFSPSLRKERWKDVRTD